MIKIFLSKFVILLCLNCCINVYAQNILSGIRYQLGSSANLSEKIPFWMRANHYGLVPLEGSFVTVQGSASKDYDSTESELHKKKILDMVMVPNWLLTLVSEAKYYCQRPM